MDDIPYTPSHVSVNRVRIVDMPGVALDPDVRGQRAYDLLSIRALLELMHRRAAELEIEVGEFDDRGAAARLPWRFEAMLRDDRGSSHAAAVEIASQLGRRLGIVLLALHRGDPANRQARDDWSDADWNRWAKIRTVWLGGGLAAGILGQTLALEASRLLLQYDAGIRVSVSDYAEKIALLGAARYIDGHERSTVCFDFGHTRVKRCSIKLAGSELESMEMLPPMLVPLERPEGVGDLGELGQTVHRFVTEIIGRTISRALAPDGAPLDIVCSIAAYVRGSELLGNGLYATMSTVSDDPPARIAKAVRAATGRSVRVRFIHDGTAAAAMHAGTPDAAVLLIGTALGIGFPPESAEGLRSLAPALPGHSL